MRMKQKNGNTLTSRKNVLLMSVQLVARMLHFIIPPFLPLDKVVVPWYLSSSQRDPQCVKAQVRAGLGPLADQGRAPPIACFS